MPDEHQEEDFVEEGGGFKAWLEDNLRIILSILVVFAIAGGIYSYSQRSQAPAITEEPAGSNAENSQPSAPDDQSAQNKADDSKNPATETKKDDTTNAPDSAKPAELKPAETAKPAPVMTESKETETAFIETAAKGDSATLLARQAIASFLEKNPDSTISKEHKIYMEDYLRKHVVSGPVHVGTSIEFSKDMIRTALEQSKQLNDRQLTNLKKYSSRAVSLR